MNRVLAHALMHICCEYGEYSLNRSGVIALTSCYDLEGRRGKNVDDTRNLQICTSVHYAKNDV